MRLIDVDALKADYRMADECKDCKTPVRACEYDRVYTKMDFCSWLDDAPTVKPEQKKDEWIPISKETNPAKSGWYLVTVHEDATIDNERFTAMAEFNATDGVWYDIDEPTDMYLRWMPLPEPYKGE